MTGGKRQRPLLGVVVLVSLLAQWAQAADIESVRLWRAPDNTRLVFDLSGPAEHTLFTLSNPERIVIDISNARLTANTGGLELDNTPLTGLRSAPRDGGDLRVVLDLSEAVNPKSFVLPPNQQYGDRLVVDLQRTLDARVTVRVEDIDGVRIEGAEVAWLSDTPLCVPGEARTVDANGRVQTAVGAGEHTLVVDAEGYEMIYEAFTFESGQERELAVVLTPEVVEEPEPEAALVVVERRQIRILEKVLFETAKAVIRPESFELLDQVAQTVLDNPGVGRVEVSGHTDARGSDSYNMDLSQRRADAVRAFLIRRGVSEDRLLSQGYGEERPIADNETDDGREANRRVEFNLIDVPDDDDPVTEPVEETP